MSRAHLIVVAELLSLAACGGDNAGVRPPTGPSATPTALSLTPATDLIRIKGSETFAASATFSDGSTRTVQATWGSDATPVATVDGGGRVTGAGSGQATIFADYNGLRATRLLRVIPDYQGRWSGNYRLISCTDDGDWRRADFCDDLEMDSLFRFTMGLTQNRDAVTGDADLGDLPGPVQGSIMVSGHLRLNGTMTLTLEDGGIVEASLSNWETLTTDNERMTGPFTIVFRAPGIDGAANVACEMRIVSKSSLTSLDTVGSGEGTGFRPLLSRVGRRQ